MDRFNVRMPSHLPTRPRYLVRSSGNLIVNLDDEIKQLRSNKCKESSSTSKVCSSSNRRPTTCRYYPFIEFWYELMFTARPER